MNKIIRVACALLLFVTTGFAQTGSAPTFLSITELSAQTTNTNAIDNTSGTPIAVPYGDSVKKGVRLGGLCNGVTSNVPIDTATTGNTQLVSGTASQLVYVCGFNFINADAVDVRFVSGTGTNCATSQTNVTGLMQFLGPGGNSVPNPGAMQFATAVTGHALCIRLSASIQVGGYLAYVKTATP